MELLVRFHPIASDLRRVVAGMKLNFALERVAREATEIARKARELNTSPAFPEVQFIEEMHEHVQSMLKDAVDCFVREDIELALTLKPRDRVLDQINAFTSEQLIERMSAEPAELNHYLNLIFIGRHLERVGDYATNIGEEAVYAAAAEDIRHQHDPSFPSWQPPALARGRFAAEGDFPVRTGPHL